jgi:hypothetical protein
MMGSGGFRPTAKQNNPTSVSATGGNGQSGKFVAEKVAKATQLRPSGYSQGENTAMAQQISEGGNVSTTANAANPASRIPAAGAGMDIASILGAIEPLDSEPKEFRPIPDGVDFGSGRGSEALPPSLNPSNRQIENVELVKKYLPDLLNAARMPGAPDSYKRMINSLIREIM